MAIIGILTGLLPVDDLNVNDAANLDCDAYEVLTPMGEALAAKPPLAAVLISQSMILIELERL